MKRMNHVGLLAAIFSLLSSHLLAVGTENSAGLGYISAETMRPALTRDGIIDVESATTKQKKDFEAGLWFGYSDDPIVYNRLTNGELVREIDVVNHRVGGSLMGAYGFNDWFELGLELPLVLFQSGATNIPGVAAANNLTEVKSFALGDLRLRPKFNIFSQEDSRVNFAIIANLWLPTNTPRGQWAGEEGLRFSPGIAFSKTHPKSGLRWAINAGLNFRDPFHIESLDLGQDFDLRAGIGYSLKKHVNVPLALDASVRTQAQLYPNPFSDESDYENGLEANVGLNYDIKDRFNIFAGYGRGFISGPAIPDWRVFAGLRYMKNTDRDQDKDGIINAKDACPTEAEDTDGFEDTDGCPDIDNDGDGLNDDGDKCPNEAEDKDGFEDADGCPDEDNDQDGVSDANDACPDEKGDKARGGCPVKDTDGDGLNDDEDKCPNDKGTKELNGCPIPDADEDGIADADDKCPKLKGLKAYAGCPDTDGDGIADNIDKCPKEQEVINGVDDEDGCPDKGKSLVKVTKEKIEILDSVYFDSGKDVIRNRSFGLLDQVATTLNHSPQIKKVQVEGHTDSAGADDTNQTLSQARAEAVVKYLVSKGVSSNRLSAKGFGETQPIADNGTASGRAQNRRVVFTVVE